MPDRQPTRLHRQLGAELAMQRSLSGLSGRDLAVRLGVSQPTVVRVENAQKLPGLPLVRLWLDAVEADSAARDRVLALTEGLHSETVRWPTLLAGRTHLQDEVHQRELDSVSVRNFQPTVIPGLLQTSSYTQALLPLTDITGTLDHAATAAGRLERQRLLYEPDRQFQFLIAEPVLSWSPGENIMPAQLDRVLQLNGLASVEIAVLPLWEQVATPWHNFVIHSGEDERFVTTELIHGTQRIADLDDIGLYEGLWDRLWRAALTGDDANTFIRERLGAAGSSNAASH